MGVIHENPIEIIIRLYLGHTGRALSQTLPGRRGTVRRRAHLCSSAVRRRLSVVGIDHALWILVATDQNDVAVQKRTPVLATVGLEIT